MKELRILVIEDDPLTRKSLYDRLRKWGHDALACDCLAEARAFLDKQDFDLIISDIRLPDGDGLKFMAEQKKDRPELDVVIMTAYADVPTAVAAIKSGARDYLPKPFEVEHLEKIVRNAAELRALSRQVHSLAQLAVKEVGEVLRFGEMIGASTLGPIFERARMIAQAPDTTALIMGESGTGKGMLAKAIHLASPRVNEPFVDINCAAIPEQLIESELFGYEKGAFTDAKSRRAGLFEAADGGTIFLDEIGDMDLKLQGKILKVIEDKAFRRLGSEKMTRVDVRIVAATNRDLKARVKESAFREDLYYRLSVLPIVMPPLRDHRENIPPLAHYFLKTLGNQMGAKAREFSASAMAALRQYDWPGNVRELRNVVERSIILTPGPMIETGVLGLPGVDPLAAPALAPGAGVPIMSLAAAEKQLIQAVLSSVAGNKNKAAEILQIHRTTLYKKMTEYKLA